MDKSKCEHVKNAQTHKVNVYCGNKMFILCNECMTLIRRTMIKEINLNYLDKHMYDIQLADPLRELCCECHNKEVIYVVLGEELNEIKKGNVAYYKFVCDKCFNIFSDVQKYCAMKIIKKN